MFIKEVKKQNSKKGKVFFQYYLIQSMRVDGKPRQRNILYLGSRPVLQDKSKRKIVAQLLEDKIYEKPMLFASVDDAELLTLVDHYYKKYLNKYQGLDTDRYFSKPPNQGNVEFEAINVEALDLNDTRSFGAEHLCYGVLKKIGLEGFLSSQGFTPLQITRGLISIIARAIFVSSEHKTAQYLQVCSALNELFGMDFDQITRHHLYDISDTLYEHKDFIDGFLYNRFVEMFDLDDSLVIYDLSNSYFEGAKRGSDLAQYGKSKEKRNDCKQVVFTGVINQAGFVRHSRIYQGNQVDCLTLGDMLDDLKSHSPIGTKHTVVIDAGIATEANLAVIRGAGLNYVCVARKQIKDYASRWKSEKVFIQDNNASPIELAILEDPEQPDTWIYVKSERKTRKEQSMDIKLNQRFEQDLQTAKAALDKKGGIKKTEKVYERIGRIKQKHKTVQAKYNISIKSNGVEATDIIWKRKETNNNNKAKLNPENQGVYFIRTNIALSQEKHIWKVYNTIREVEATFRCLKTDLQIRPIHHQNDQRVEAHIYLTILAYQLVNAIRFLLKQSNIHYDWSNIVRIMNTQQMATVELKTQGKTVCVRKASRPNKEALEIYKAAGVSSMPKKNKKYVVYH